MERLTDERLAELIGAAKRSNYMLYVLCDGTSDALDALVELRDRRAADKDAPKEPPLFDKDLVDLVCYYERYIMDNWTDTPDERCGIADATVNALTELQGYRAAEREQAAPEPRKPAKWERRLRKIDGSLRYKDDQWEVWWEPQRGVVMDAVDFGKTPQAAVEAAWKAWKEARRDA